MRAIALLTLIMSLYRRYRSPPPFTMPPRRATLRPLRLPWTAAPMSTMLKAPQHPSIMPSDGGTSTRPSF